MNKNEEIAFLILTGFSCNNNCIFCSNINDRAQDRSTSEILEDIKTAHNQKKYNTIEFLGGEVTIRSDFFKLISYANQLGFKKIRITTNGRMFSYPEFSKKAVKAGLKDITVSIYGHNKKLHEGATRSPGSFEQCVIGIKNIKKTKGLNLLTSTVVSKINYKYLYEIGSFVHKLGSSRWNIFDLIPDGKGAENYDILMVNYKKISPYINKIYNLTNKINITIYDFPLCLFENKFFNNEHILFFTPETRYRHSMKQVGYGFSHRVDKISKKSKIIYQDKYRMKTDFCKKCLYFNKCQGITKQYFKKYGIKEIKELSRINIGLET